MKKAILCLLLTLTLLLGLSVVLTASAASTVASGTTGSLTWKLDSAGKLTISGEGAMPYYGTTYTDGAYRTAAPWSTYWSQIKTVNITSGITAVGDWAFYGCSALTSVTLPAGLTTIGDRAFYNCSALTSVTFPTGLTSIGDAAFYDCTGLTSVTFPAGLTSIGNDAFSRCTGLTSVTFPAGLTTIGYYAFGNCTNLTSVTFPTGLTTIGDSAFYDCNGLTSAEFLGNAPATFGSSVFDWAHTNFVLYYHYNSTGWTTPTWNGYKTACIDLPLDNLSALDENNRNAQGILFTLNDEANTATVGDNSATANNSGYYGVSFGAAVIPAEVTKGGKTYRVIGVGQYAFSGNPYVKTVEIGKNITSVDPTAFPGCTNLTAFTVAAGNTSYSAPGGILFDYGCFYLYCYPAGKTGKTYTVPNTVTAIGALAFAGNTHLQTLTVPDSVRAIGSVAFGNCTALKQITLPFIGTGKTANNSFRSVFSGSYSYNCSVPESLTDVIITGGTLNRSAFFGCSNIQRITLPGDIASIPQQAFWNCSSLQELIFAGVTEQSTPGEISIPASVTSVYYDAFYGCTKIAAFIVDKANPNYCSDKWGVLYTKDMTTLVDYPCARKWPYYNVSDKTTEICGYAFDNCTNLVNLYIPNSVVDDYGTFITECPGMTVCAYLDSYAYNYAIRNNIPAWPMDNFALQNIEIYSLPEKTEFAVGEVDLSGLYLTMNGGKTLQLDDYALEYDDLTPGKQTVTVSYNQQQVTFEITLTGEQLHRIDFGTVNIPDGADAYIAVYGANQQMLSCSTVTIRNGKAQLIISDELYAKMTDAKLFVLQSATLAPVTAMDYQ